MDHQGPISQMNKYSGVVTGLVNELRTQPPVLPLKPGQWTLIIHSVFIDNITPPDPLSHIYANSCQFQLSSNFVTQLDFDSDNHVSHIVETPLHIFGNASLDTAHIAFYFTVPTPTPYRVNAGSNSLKFNLSFFESGNLKLSVPIYESAIYRIHYTLQRVCNES